MIDSAYLTPQQIVAELDKYIIGQHEAKRNVARQKPKTVDDVRAAAVA